ncbi:hypothetical protein SPRG_15271 [Saprolegnia parasitica CBS 223.65]|uniref:Uncharacterized protein n=1 Tax=Saprolegnia parasitica (strain CBS 223.65) TaxID=695850 RepID=A0A067BYG9_SAPPC|nr:hypothetical protein SPRG_15271 [Saprolegnia parasitica CBS 223.65]KDO19607.1 hypothetical protein SPRG_15271 [Saprolegnia parasitica CBS 223.65]|eukprot:XP_012209702.1 hypothetical protein SPRG_15271 [Saprolegnia parasitica CBS 223.65]
MHRVRKTKNLVFFQYPVLRALFSFDFGTGRLSLLHFQPRDYDEISAWGEANGSIMQDYSLTATLLTAVAPCIVDLSLSLFYNKDDVVQWINSVFEQLHSDISDDLYGDDATALHLRTRYLFDADSRELHSRLSAEYRRQLATVMASFLSLGGQATGTGAVAPKPGTPGAKNKGGNAPVSTAGLAPKKDGVPLCLKYVSNQHCTGKNTCKKPRYGITRAHFSPTEALKPDLIAYIKKSLGGFSLKFEHLETST